MKRNEPKPLNLEEIRNEWRNTERLHMKRVFHLVAKTKQPATINKSEIEEEKLYLVKQCIKSACEFYLRYKDKPGLLIKECPELIKKFVKEHDLMEVFFAKEDILEIKVVDGSIIAFLEDRTGLSFSKKEYNDWLFKLAFKSVLEDENGKANGEYVEIILKSDVKSAVHGLLEEIDEMIEWYEENRKEDYHIFTAKRDTALRIKTKIKKWFPDILEEGKN